MKTLKVLRALLSYPSAELAGAAAEMKQAIAADAALPADVSAGLADLIDDLAGMDVYDAQERYVLLFDRTRSLSLHLFEHVHGESRDRGQAMVDLRRQYLDAGFEPTTTELPDYLPMFLEFAATRDPRDAIALIAEPGHVFAALRERLAKRRSLYARAFAALVALGNARLDETALAALRAEPDPEPDDFSALDAAWEEEQVSFGPAADDCGADALAAKLRQVRRPAPGLERPAGQAPQTVFSANNRVLRPGA
jgi:nitrate reductase delta subunit